MIERPKTNPKKDKRILAIEDLFIRLCCFDSPYFTLLLDVHFYPYLTNDGKRTKKKSRQKKLGTNENDTETKQSKNVRE